MKDFYTNNSLIYVDLDKYVLGSNGLIRDEFYSEDKNDHHYNMKRFRKLLEERFPTEIWTDKIENPLKIVT